MKRILLTGKNGQVGWELQRTLCSLGEVFAYDRSELDLTSPRMIRNVVQEVRPEIIVNAAAYTAVDRAESEPALAMKINAEAAGLLALEGRSVGAVMAHYSTDYVFDGSKSGPYAEEDRPNPLNVYGRSKLAGEQAIREAGIPHFIFRTSWVYGSRGRNFLLTILRLARERSELKIVDDQVGAPTWSRLIAEATAQVLAQFSFPGGRNRLLESSGTYHLTAGGQTSWCGFANAILAGAHDNLSTPLLTRRAEPIGSRDYPTPAGRPKNSVLSGHKLEQTFGIAMPDWSDCLEKCLLDLGNQRL
jgi:dTDP-4-dehydrorhamnose reductase